MPYERTRRPPPAVDAAPTTYQGTGTALCGCPGYVLAWYRGGDLYRLTLIHTHRGTWKCRGTTQALDINDPTWNPPPREIGAPDPFAVKPVRQRAERDDPHPRNNTNTSPRADLTADGRRRRG